MREGPVDPSNPAIEWKSDYEVITPTPDDDDDVDQENYNTMNLMIVLLSMLLSFILIA